MQAGIVYLTAATSFSSVRQTKRSWSLTELHLYSIVEGWVYLGGPQVRRRRASSLQERAKRTAKLCSRIGRRMRDGIRHHAAVHWHQGRIVRRGLPSRLYSLDR